MLKATQLQQLQRHLDLLEVGLTNIACLPKALAKEFHCQF